MTFGTLCFTHLSLLLSKHVIIIVAEEEEEQVAASLGPEE